MPARVWHAQPRTRMMLGWVTLAMISSLSHATLTLSLGGDTIVANGVVEPAYRVAGESSPVSLTQFGELELQWWASDSTTVYDISAYTMPPGSAVVGTPSMGSTGSVPMTASNWSLPVAATGPGEAVLVLVLGLDSASGSGLSVLTIHFNLELSLLSEDCNQLSNCTGHGTCVHVPPALPYCVCEGEWMFDDCSGVLEVIVDGNVIPQPVQLCPGEPFQVHGRYPSSHRPFVGDVVVIDDMSNNPTAFSYMQGSTTSPPQIPIRENTFTFVKSVPGLYDIVLTATGRGYLPVIVNRIEVLPWHDASCFPEASHCDPYATPDAQCSGHGTCTGPLGASTCTCDAFFFGFNCEYGCTDTFITGYGGVITDGTQGVRPALPFSSCRFTLESDFSGAQGIHVTFDRFSINSNFPLVFTGFRNNRTTRGGTEIPSDLSLPGSSMTIDFSSPYFNPGLGFSLRWWTLGCTAGNFIDLEAGGSVFAPACKPCPIGTHTAIDDQTQCSPCPPGTFSATQGASSCDACKPGEHQSLSGQTQCEPCAPGTAGFDSGLQDCLPCSAGRIAPSTGMISCTRCPLPAYANTTGMTECFDCPPNTQAPFLGAESLADCTCMAGYYHPDAAWGVPCVPCPKGAFCEGGAAAPVALPGFWSAQDAPFVFHQCVDPEFCSGGNHSACRFSREGYLCHACPDGYQERGDSCVACSDSTSAAFPLVLIVLGVGLSVFYHIANINENDNLRFTLGMGTALGLYVQYLQFVELFREFRVRWPETLASALSSVGIVNLDFEIFSPSCSFPMDYHTRLLLRLLLPVLLSAVIFAFHAVHRLHGVFVSLFGGLFRKLFPRLTNTQAMRDAMLEPGRHIATRVKLWIGTSLVEYRPMQWRRSVNCIVLLAEFTYISVITATFELFGCVHVLDGRKVVSKHPSLVCYESEWKSMLYLPTLGILLYIVALPLLYLYGVWSIQSTESKMNDKHYRAWRTFSSVVFKYKASLRFWMFIVLLRKLILSIAIASFPSVPLLQVTGSIVVLVVSLILQMLHRPYRLRQHNQVEWVLTLHNVLLLLAGLLFYTNTLGTVSHLLISLGAAAVLSSALIFIIVILSIEAYRALTDLRVNIHSSPADLYARRHLPYDAAVGDLLARLRLETTALFRYMSVAHDENLLELSSVARLVMLGRLQSQTVAHTSGLRKWSQQYSTSRIPAIDTSQSHEHPASSASLARTSNPKGEAQFHTDSYAQQIALRNRLRQAKKDSKSSSTLQPQLPRPQALSAPQLPPPPPPGTTSLPAPPLLPSVSSSSSSSLSSPSSNMPSASSSSSSSKLSDIILTSPSTPKRSHGSQSALGRESTDARSDFRLPSGRSPSGEQQAPDLPLLTPLRVNSRTTLQSASGVSLAACSPSSTGVSPCGSPTVISLPGQVD